MKQKDIALLMVVVFLSAAFSIVISRLVFNKPENRQQMVVVVQPISSQFPDVKNLPDDFKRYFNDQAFDPTKLIKIGDNTNPAPFNAKQQ